jgi:hypothetical protein
MSCLFGGLGCGAPVAGAAAQLSEKPARGNGNRPIRGFAAASRCRRASVGFALNLRLKRTGGARDRALLRDCRSTIAVATQTFACRDDIGGHGPRTSISRTDTDQFGLRLGSSA